MIKRSICILGLVLLIVNVSCSQSKTPAIKSYFDEISRTVREGDYEGMCALYDEDAVLVTSSKSMPISQALEGWKQGILDTKSGKAKSNVEFRLAEIKSSKTTNHVTGIFYYTSEDQNGKSTADVYVHFEMLLILKDNYWVALMEYQKSEASETDWNLLAH